jgi:hypothetical protein
MTPLLTWLLVVVGAIAAILQLRGVSAGLADARKEVSRYRLYAARDDLVRLVVRGEMNEADDAWAAAYATITNLLNIHERLDIYSVVKRYSRFRNAVAANPALKREVELRDREMKRASRDVPGFKAALDALDHGFFVAMSRQTDLIHGIAVLFFVNVYSRRAASPGALSTWAQRMCNA